MTTETPPQGPLVPVQRPPPRTSASSSLVQLLWGLSGVLVGVVLGAAGVGENVFQRFGGEARPVREVSELTGRLGELRGDLTARERELSAERQERKEAVAALKQTLEASEWNSLAATLKGDFLGRFLAYEQSKSDNTRRQLVDTICGLRTQAKSARMTIVSGPMELSIDEIRRGGSADLDPLLAQMGLGADLLAQARRAPSNVQIPAVTPFNVFEVQRAAQQRRIAMREVNDAVAAVQRQLQNIKQVKSMKFSDGSEYAIPQPVARLMLSRQDCRSD